MIAKTKRRMVCMADHTFKLKVTKYEKNGYLKLLKFVFLYIFTISNKVIGSPKSLTIVIFELINND